VKYSVCDGNSRVCQFEKISARILDARINTLRQGGSNSKRLYDRYRPERSRNELGGWCNTLLNHLLRYSRKTRRKRGMASREERAQNLDP
jgi:hypothetical protein